MRYWAEFILFSILLVSFVSAQEYSLDIRTDKSEYSQGEQVKYTVLLLKENVPLNKPIEISITDAFSSQTIKKSVKTNSENVLVIENNFSSGYWKIEASYENKKVTRIFSVTENEEVLFQILEDTLVIKNNGNVPYTKTIQILIGNEIITETQNIPVGGKKEIKLIAPDGTYNIEVSDGEQRINQKEVQLTGNAIGLFDKDLVNKVPIFGSGAREVQEGSKSIQQLFSSARIVPAAVFIFGVFVLGILSFIERKARKKSK